MEIIMKRLGLCLIYLIPLSLFLGVIPGMPQDQEQNENIDKINGVSEGELLSCQDTSSLLFYENLSQIPIKFLRKSTDGEFLIGQFASPTVIFFKEFKFRITSEIKDERNLFFETDGNWEQEISRKTFIKKIKKDFWLVTYLTVNQENIICRANQFRDWESLRISYGHEAKLAVDTMEFWKNMRAKFVFFYQIDEIQDTGQEAKSYRAYWTFVVPTNGISMAGDDELELLDSDKLVRRIQQFSDGEEARIIDHGFFIINDQTIFHTIDLKIPKLPRIKLARMEFGMLKARPRPVDKDYFFKTTDSPWTCFYNNKDGKLLRAVEAVSPEENGENKKNGNNDENGKNTK